jgi:hypothetical protein
MTVNQGGTLLTWVAIHSQLSHVTSLQWKVRVWWVLSNISAFCIFICVSEVNFTNNSTCKKHNAKMSQSSSSYYVCKQVMICGGNKRDVQEESNGQYVVQLSGSYYLLQDSLVPSF